MDAAGRYKFGGTVFDETGRCTMFVIGFKCTDPDCTTLLGAVSELEQAKPCIDLGDLTHI